MLQCCDDPDELEDVPGFAIGIGIPPYNSVVQIRFKLYLDYDYYGVGSCSGTISQRADVILTAGHCVKVSTQ